MTSRIVIVCCVVGVAIGSRFSDLMITTPKSPFSEGESALARGPSPLPCDCGPNALCVYNNDTTDCSCADGYIGTPPKCKPGPELWDTCYQDNPCGPNSDCRVENGTRICECLLSFEGSPPNCQPPSTWDTCLNSSCGANSRCDASFPYPFCFCLPGFVGSPPSCQPGVALLDRCNPYPCGGHSDCHMQDGVPVCSCLPGFVGAPPNCAPGPEMWRVCFKDSPCGLHSECRMEERAAVCLPCPQGYLGKTPHCFAEVTTVFSSGTRLSAMSALYTIAGIKLYIANV